MKIKLRLTCVAQFTVKKLVDHKFVTALVELAKSESNAAREQVARVLLAMCEDQKNRGFVVAQVNLID